MKRNHNEAFNNKIINNFWNEDCTEGSSKHLPDCCIDLLLSDPPYGIDGDKLDKHYNRDESNVVEGYVEVSSDNYNQFTLNWIKEAYRVLKPGGRIIIISGYTHLHSILHALKENHFIYLNHIIWKYNFGVWTTKKFVTSHYHILYFIKPPFNNIFVQGIKDEGTVWEINREYQPGKIKNKNQLPHCLLKKLISLSSQPGDLVCDFFLGSFSTAVVSVQMGRNATGFELNPNAFEHGFSNFKSSKSVSNFFKKETTLKPLIHPINNSKQLFLPLDFSSISSKKNPTDNSIDLIISRLDVLPTDFWFSSTKSFLKDNDGFLIIIINSELLLDTILLLKKYEFIEINHIIWKNNNNNLKETVANVSNNHLHVLFYEKTKNSSRKFNTFSRFSPTSLTSKGNKLNYADREDVWLYDYKSKDSYNTLLNWKSLIRKCIEYLTVKNDCIASFTSFDDCDLKKECENLNRKYFTI